MRWGAEVQDVSPSPLECAPGRPDLGLAFTSVCAPGWTVLGLPADAFPEACVERRVQLHQNKRVQLCF